MGSFSMNCSISGLGIGGGTPVRCLLLTQSPYDNSDPRSAWIIRTPPIRAQYNDYGSIAHVHPDDRRIAELWLRGLREDAVEKGLGDNSYHDVPVSRDMSFEQMLDAIQERRLEVIQDVRNFWAQPKRGVGDAGDGTWVPPLMKRVSEVLEKMQPGCVSPTAADDKYVVDEPVPGMARVRFGRFGECDRPGRLGLAQTALGLENLACVITAGTGRYADDTDLLVFPRPREAGSEHVSGPQWDMRKGASADDDKILRVGLAMIREDVWQALIAFPHSDYVSNQYPKVLEFPHVVQKHQHGAYAWYDLFAFKLCVRKAWSGLRRALLRKDAPEGEKDFTPAQQKRLNDFIAKSREEQAKRRAAMTDEERAAEDEKHKAHIAYREAEETRKQEQPFFGDFRITSMYHDAVRDLPGAWTLVDSTPGVIGIGAHFSMLLADKVDAWDGLLDGVAELAAVRHVMAGVGVVMRPAESTGPQCTEWGETIRYQQALLTVATAVGVEHEAEAAPASLAEISQRPCCPHGYASTAGDECGECEAQGLPPADAPSAKKRTPAKKPTKKRTSTTKRTSTKKPAKKPAKKRATTK